MMKKSKYFFLIMGTTYLIIAILVFANVFETNTNFLLALSITSLSISLSDICSSFVTYLSFLNDINYTMKQTHEYLSNKMEEELSIACLKKDTEVAGGNPLAPLIHSHYVPLDTNAVIKNIENIYPRMNSALKNEDLAKKLHLLILNKFHTLFFVLGIAVFLVMPFVNIDLAKHNDVSILITIVAFAAICFSIDISERITDVIAKKSDFINGTGIAIEGKHPGYFSYINLR